MNILMVWAQGARDREGMGSVSLCQRACECLARVKSQN